MGVWPVSRKGFDIAFPVFMQQFGMFAGLHMNGDDFWGDPGSEFECLFGDAAPAVDGNDSDGRRFLSRGFDRVGAGGALTRPA